MWPEVEPWLAPRFRAMSARIQMRWNLTRAREDAERARVR